MKFYCYRIYCVMSLIIVLGGYEIEGFEIWVWEDAFFFAMFVIGLLSKVNIVLLRGGKELYLLES